MEKIRKGDEVIILTGRDRQRRGTILVRVDAERVVVEGINVVKKHVRPNPAQGTTGGIIEKSMPMHISNVALFNPATGKADRVGIKEVDGRRVRIFRSSGEVVGAKA
jgi:large subunit ribosomal protein L24